MCAIKQQIYMHHFQQQCGGSNHGSPVFIRFGYLVANWTTHSLKSIDHFLTVKDRPCHLDQHKVHYMLRVFVRLFDVDGDRALINSTKLVIRGELGQDLKEGYKENLKPTLKLVAPVLSPPLPSRYWSL